MTRGKLLIGLGDLAMLLFFFLVPWIRIGVGPFNVSSLTGLGLAQQVGDILYIIPVCAVLSLGLILLAIQGSYVAENQAAWGQFVLAVPVMVALAIVVPNLMGGVPILVFKIQGTLAFGLWATVAGLAAVIAGAIIELKDVSRH